MGDATLSDDYLNWVAAWRGSESSPAWPPIYFMLSSDQHYGRNVIAKICASHISALISGTAPKNPSATTYLADPVKLTQFITYVHFRTRLHNSVTFMAVYYMSRLQGRFPASRDPHGRLLFLSAFMIATKLLEDYTYYNMQWHIVSQRRFTIPQIAEIELKMCFALDWDLQVDPRDLLEYEQKICQGAAGAVVDIIPTTVPPPIPTVSLQSTSPLLSAYPPPVLIPASTLTM